jgi:hypothetical protein
LSDFSFKTFISSQSQQQGTIRQFCTTDLISLSLRNLMYVQSVEIRTRILCCLGGCDDHWTTRPRRFVYFLVALPVIYNGPPEVPKFVESTNRYICIPKYFEL